ncbi:aminodeoxychorismate lyase [Salinimonas chungwhensis]|uniref:aminodeoxychorismate lyase n=1 Tax=Salinimonas chungwhensis TaxID=265425 RepID=UPI00036FAD88|nr:aminodeoxychorismate lyase [Salinimonas chungwhensis]
MQTFPLNDRAANYGDAVFTTMSVVNGQVALFNRHVERLRRDASKLGVKLDTCQLSRAVSEQARVLSSGTLKLLISAGQGGRGYARDKQSQPCLYFSHHPVPLFYDNWRTTGISLALSSVKLSRQPLLAGLKHCNRLEQVLIKQTIPDYADDVLVCDQCDNIIEASAANLFWLKNDRWCTPSLAYCGVAGVMREFLLSFLQDQGHKVECGNFSLKEAEQASAMLISNALMQIVPVHTLHVRQKISLPIGPVKTLQDEIKTAYQDEINGF